MACAAAWFERGRPAVEPAAVGCTGAAGSLVLGRMDRRGTRAAAATRSGGASPCAHYRLAPLKVRALSPPFDSAALGSAFGLDRFPHVLAYGDPNSVGLLTSSNGIGLVQYLNNMLPEHVRPPAQSRRTIAVGTSGGAFLSPAPRPSAAPFRRSFFLVRPLRFKGVI